MRVLVVLLVATVVRAAPPGDGVVTDVSTLSSAELLEHARTEANALRFEKALWLLSVCVQREPKNHDCVVMLASNYARRGASTRNREDDLEAARWYRRFLEVAPPSDKRINQVVEILGQANLPLDAKTPVEPLRVVLGRPRVVRTRDVIRVAVTDTSVVKVVMLNAGSELRFEGKRTGTTRVTASNDDRTTTRWDVTVEKE
ncbi:MAG: pilus assembly protein N-terminal domain-containing protein [Myxococcaceae bacterium]|nr:pilus assembly protein N-terminal domain-containing protein [Myxococcaceae bacterium]